jgi:hypothetical protein
MMHLLPPDVGARHCPAVPRISRRPLLRALVALVALSTSAASASIATGAQLRPQDEIWLVSHRGLGGSAQSAPKMQYWRYDRVKGWTRSSLDQLLASEDPNVITTVFVHGNRIDWCEAFTKGWNAYRRLVATADERPVRFIIWSWPSGRIRGPVQDAREKAARTNPSGYYLAWFLDKLNPKAPVSLWAHSFGARIATGALHLLGGGRLGAYQLASRTHATRDPVQVVLLVAALDNDWLAKGHFHGQAMTQVSAMLLVNNNCDALLRRYHLLYGRHCDQEALGYMGPAGWAARPSDRAKVAQVEASYAVGKDHAFAGFLCATSLVDKMRLYLLFDRPSSSHAAKEKTTPDAESIEVAAVSETHEGIAE